VVLRRSWGAPCLKLRQDATVHSMRFKTTCPVIFGRGAQLEKKAGTIENKQDEDGLTASKTDHHSLGIFHAQLTHRYLASSPFVSSDSSVTTVRCYSLPLDSSRVWCRFPASALLLCCEQRQRAPWLTLVYPSTIAISLCLVLCRFRLSPRRVLE
jgi:hypothetical protein